jgi:cysteine desulfurase
MEKIIYLDHAATTPARPEVVEAMLPYFTDNFWNPSSVYTPAGKNRKAIDEARDLIGKSLGALGKDIYFTAGGSESDNWALKAAAEAYQGKESILLPVPLSTMRSYTPASTWNPKDMK